MVLLTIRDLNEYKLSNIMKPLKSLNTNLNNVSSNLTGLQKFQHSLCQLIDTFNSNIDDFAPYL